MLQRIDADLVIVGNGDKIQNGSVVFEDQKIRYVDGQEGAPDADNTVTTPVVMPGLWDCHVHYTGFIKPMVEQALLVPPQLSALRASWDARETLLSGFTSVREMGGNGVFLNRAIREGFIEGPRIYGANRIIGTTGGHSDIHNTPLDLVHRLIDQASPIMGELADGRAECLRAVRKQIRMGAEVIKYCASGGVMSEIDHPIHQQFSHGEQSAIVEEASRADLAVAAHCHGAPGIRSALEAGVKTIEHGTYLDEDLADMMLEKDAILVPTRYVVQKLFEGSDANNVPEYAMTKLRALYNQHREAVKLAIKKGVKIALGTDTFTSGPGNIFKWGDSAWELVYLTELGMSTEDAIRAGTMYGPQTLGKRAPQSGLLQEGYDSDLLLLNDNPLDDIKVLTDRSNIRAIVKQGKFVSG